jgi:hypothetical protein
MPADNRDLGARRISERRLPRVRGSGQAVDLAETASGAFLVPSAGSSQVFDLQWDLYGRQIAAAFGDATAVVIPAALLLKPVL